MTCIVGIVEDGKVHIGGDSAGVSGLDLVVRKDKKVFRNGEYIFGFTSSFRMGQLLAFTFNPPKNKGKTKVDTYEFMVNTFIPELRKCLKEGGYAETHNGAERGGIFLVGYQGRLFMIDSDYQVGEPVDNFAACGCGENIALGAMYATKELPPLTRLETALMAAERFSAGVRAPFVFVSE